RLGQWMDWDNSYYTMSDENNYAIWHFLKVCNDKGLIYKGHDSVPWCPRCETAISQHEILTEDYKELTHDSVIMQFPIIEKDREFLLVWTTTPWTIPANIAVAVDKGIDYSLIKTSESDKKFWVAKNLTEKIFKDKKFEIIKTVKGKELEGLHYKSVFDGLPAVEKARQENPKLFHSVIITDPLLMPISVEEGTGMVHTAVSAGEEDFKLGKKLGLPMIPVIGDNADYLEGLGQFSGKNAKNNPKIILDYMKDFAFSIFPYKHRYPACWRCKTELVWKVADEWYISMDELRKKLMAVVEKIKWIPGFGLSRELDWLKNMHDWMISKKNRYWGLALPIYECKCGNFEIIGSKEELKKRAVEGWRDFEGHTPHRPFIDKVKIKCSKCGKKVSRVLDVGNPWLDAGIVPYSTIKYFEDRKYWQDWFPVDLVCESFPGQFKNWFYAIIVMSVVLEDVPPVRTIFGHALVRDEKGEEMHKSKGNAVWFDEAAEKTGVDPMRWVYARQNPEDNLKFGWHVIEETKRKLLNLINSVTFLKTYTDKVPSSKFQVSKNILDRWIIASLNKLIKGVSESLNKYDPAAASKAIEEFFINDLSLWYIRRSRPRFQRPQNEEEKKQAAGTLYYVLLNLAKLIAPFMPFLAEDIYQKMEGEKQSVHLEDWPEYDEKLMDEDLLINMSEARKIVSIALEERAKSKIGTRQPLAAFSTTSKIGKDFINIIKDEINVKEIKTGQKENKLDTELTPELRQEGNLRELTRGIQDLRKKSGLTPKDKIELLVETGEEGKKFIEKFGEEIKKAVNAASLKLAANSGQEIKVDELIFKIKIYK
ncbi:MAG: class I tRNA ligase family protein, partial [Candidatus Parcubacteria bacterium]|nr:class I tRNA ligase family protein [Candidatus Parcubacteria bacterium]